MRCRAGPRAMAGDADSGSIGGCGMRTAPELLDVDDKQLEDVLRRAEQSLDEEDSHLIRRLFESYAYMSDLIEDENTPIRHRRQLFFGSRTEKTEAVVGAKAGKFKAASARDNAAADGSSADDANMGADFRSTASKACRGTWVSRCRPRLRGRSWRPRLPTSCPPLTS